MRWLLLVFTALVPCHGSFAQDAVSLIGRRIITKRPTPLRVEKRIVDPDKYFRAYTAERAEGAWLWIVASDVKGWVKASDVLRLDQAVEYYTRHIEECPDCSWAYLRRGVVRHELREYDLALNDYEASIRLDPKNPDPYSCRGNIWKERGELDRAIADYGEAIRIQPSEPGSYYNRGNALAEKKERDKAITDYSEALRLDPRFVRAYNNRAYAWYAIGRYHDAIRDATIAIQLAPEHVNAYVCRGMAWQGLTELARAISDYSAAVRLDGSNPDARMYRAQLLLYLRRYEEALTDLNVLVSLKTQDPAVYDRRAWIWATSLEAKMRDGKKAVESATLACELSGWKQPGHLYTLAAAFAEAGDFAKAVEIQQRANTMPGAQSLLCWGERRLRLYRNNEPLRDDERLPAPVAERPTNTSESTQPFAFGRPAVRRGTTSIRPVGPACR